MELDNIRMELDLVEKDQGVAASNLLDPCLAAGYPDNPRGLSQRRFAACDKIRERQKESGS